MKGIQYFKDTAGDKSILLIDLKKHDQFLNEMIEDLLDVIECKGKKYEPAVSFENAIKKLYRKGKISKKTYEQVTKCNV